MVSVILPCYNASKTLQATLNAIHKQSYENFELIAVDDGSQDDTLEILKSWANLDSRIVVRHQENRGVSSARNLALKSARGEYICFVDADDVVEPDYIESLVRIMLSSKSCGLAMCGFTSDMKLHSIRNFGLTSISNIDFVLRTFGYRTLNPQIWCMLFRANIIKQNKITFEEGCTRGEDKEFFAKYVLHTKEIIYSDDKLYHYRLSDVSAMATLKESSLTSIDASWRTYLYYQNSNPALAHVLLLSYYFTIWKFTVLCHMNNNMEVYRIMQNRYNIREAMGQLESFPKIEVKLTSRIYKASPFMFRLLCRMFRPIIRKR